MSKAVRAQGARKCGPRDAQGYSFEGFHVLMLPSVMKGGDIFLLYLCLSNQSDAKRSQSFCGHDFNNQQLTRQNPRKPRASRAQAARKLRASTSSHAVMDVLSGAVQAMDRHPQHALSFFQAVSKLCGRACCSFCWVKGMLLALNCRERPQREKSSWVAV